MKKVLIIAYYFPPLGWSGVQRTLKFVKYLRDFGWEPIVVTVGETKFSIFDETLVKEIPKDIKIIKIDDIKLKDITDNMKSTLKDYVKASTDLISDKDLKQLYEDSIEEKFKELRDLLLLPDGNAIWANNVIKTIENRLDLKEIDMIFTTSAPYSAHLIGHNIKKNYSIPWVADFRDEWTNNHIINYNKDGQTYKLNRVLEENIVQMADKIITVSEISTENYINNFNLDISKVLTITNGYDEEDFNEINFSEISKNDKFTIVFNGTVYPQAPPYNLINAIENLINANRIKENSIQIIFIGIVSNEIKQIVNSMAKNLKVIWIEYMSHKDSLKIAATADLLFNNAGSGEKCKASYTGKVFEYLRLNKPILVFSPKDSVLEKLLKHLNRGISIEENNIQEIEKSVYIYYDNWKKEKVIDCSEKDITVYERKNLTKRLAQCFNMLIK